MKEIKTKKNIPSLQIEINEGYTPYKFSVHKGWIPDKTYKYPVFRRKISEDLPPSNFSLQVDKVAKVIPQNTVNIDNYILKDIPQHNNATVFSVKNIVIDGILAKDMISKYVLTYKGISREVFNRTIYFIIGGYIYKFELGTFEKDFDIANKEFELMVKSFHFTKNK